MWKRLQVLVIGLVVGAGCMPTAGSRPEAASGPAQGNASAMDIRLQSGRTASIDDSALRISFESVASDSRCPKGETCFWEGSATIRLTATDASGSRRVELHTSPRGGPVEAAVGRWVIRILSLDPPAVTGRQIPQSEYVVTLRLEHGEAAFPTS